MERWILATKKADFTGLGSRLGVDPVLVRLMRNRGLETYEEMDEWLHADLSRLHDPHLLKDAEKAAQIILDHIRAGHKIMIANDFDCDGISSGYILQSCLEHLGADVYVDTPDRCLDGYGINERLIKEASDRQVSLIITCDNGIAAMEPAEYAAALGIELIITDHHEVPFVEEEGEKRYVLPRASAIVNPKQPGCFYPFKGICGAVVAFKLMQVLYDLYDEGKGAGEYVWGFLEIAAMATVADVMELKDENRILVRYGLEQMHHTDNVGLKALIEVNQLKQQQIGAYHIGFVIGPCLNASGRLSTAKKALWLLQEQDPEKAADMAQELKELNDARKDMTAKGVEQARELVEQGMLSRKVLVIFLKNCHESLAGIIAGRIREYYNRPVIVVTDTGHGLKGSGRSIPAYDMFARVSRHKHYLSRFGGHAMACGLSLPYENLEPFAQALNEDSGLTEKDLIPVVNIDIQLPIGYLSESLIRSLEMLSPYGNGNPHPLFAEKGFTVDQARILGVNRNVLKLNLRDRKGLRIDGLYFGDIEAFNQFLREAYGQEQVDRMYGGQKNRVELLLAYEPDVNEFRGVKSLQIIIRHYDVPRNNG
ncbi:MAG: single-stranded-DNA-specific exonuclease RecJ [Lachnospiraceae bacterium]|nr:single-stranded-DNA-specific exonuclease RecJ [Lachnospiraceae bacterium]